MIKTRGKERARERERAEQREKLSCDEVSVKASTEFMASSQDRLNFGDVPSWDERPGLYKCPLPTPCPRPASERSMTLDKSVFIP